MNRPLIPIINDATIGMSFDARPLTSDVQRLAVFYRDALGEEFPQYQYTLTFPERDDWAYLRVRTKNALFDAILYVEFLSSCIRIMCGREDRIDYGDPDRHIDYADPEFTEDILSKILRAYHAD